MYADGNVRLTLTLTPGELAAIDYSLREAPLPTHDEETACNHTKLRDEFAALMKERDLVTL